MAFGKSNQLTDKYINIITSIANVAASQEPGVASVSCEPGSIMDTWIPKAKNTGNCIKVEIIGNNVIVDISVNAKIGYQIPNLVCKLQEKLKAEIEKATYYKVKAVNVNIVGVVFSE